jgi:hypothetical protein
MLQMRKIPQTLWIYVASEKFSLNLKIKLGSVSRCHVAANNNKLKEIIINIRIPKWFGKSTSDDNCQS